MRMYPMARTLNGEPDVEAVSKVVAEMPRITPEQTVHGHVVKGQNTFKVCSTCHGSSAEGNLAMNAPPLAGASDWYLLKQLQNFKHKVRAFDPTRDTFGATMAPMASGLSDEDMLNVVTYINTLAGKKTAAAPQ